MSRRVMGSRESHGEPRIVNESQGELMSVNGIIWDPFGVNEIGWKSRI